MWYSSRRDSCRRLIAIVSLIWSVVTISVEKVPESESVRKEFFEMLDESEDAGKGRDFLTLDLIREAFQDAKYNPLMGSGIPEIDLQAALMKDAFMVQEPYVREEKKIGRNHPCPCGSGKKFKKCCIGKGIYD